MMPLLETRLVKAFSESLETMNQMQLSYAVIGGLAVSARSEPRFTRDIDLAVSVAQDSEAESILFQLQQRKWTISTQLEQTATDRLATARMLPPCDAGVVVDFLFANVGIEPEIVTEAELLEILPGLVAPVALLPHLVAMKTLSESNRRQQDRADLVALLGRADDKDLVRIRELITLIEQRGCARGKALHTTLDKFLSAITHD